MLVYPEYNYQIIYNYNIYFLWLVNIDIKAFHNDTCITLGVIVNTNLYNNFTLFLFMRTPNMIL